MVEPRRQLYIARDQVFMPFSMIQFFFFELFDRATLFQSYLGNVILELIASKNEFPIGVPTSFIRGMIYK